MVFLGALLIMSIIAWIFCIRNLYLEWQESARQNSVNRLDLTAPQDTPVVAKVPQSEPTQMQNYVTTEETPLLPSEATRLVLVSKELNHLVAILHVYARGLNFMKEKKKIFVIFFQKENGSTFTLLIIFYSEKSSKRSK